MSRTKKPHRSRGSIRSLLSAVVGIGLIIAGLLLWSNKQFVLDWLAYTSYTPTSEIAAIADRTKMSSDGRFYFYASEPVVQNAAEFNRSCERKESTSAILGCYANNRIYVYGVNDTRLDGIREVTAAHEMLHAVYQRLGNSEKSAINELLEKEYQKAHGNTELAERMEFYAKYEAGERYNELHSIIATEFMSIDPQLEAHYKRYFTDRSAVVTLHDTYASVFASLKERSDELLTQLEKLGPQIESQSAAYNSAVRQLNADIQAFNARATSGEFDSQVQFNAERSRLVARANSLDAQRTQIDRSTETYEQIRKEYNEIAASSNELYKSMDSNLVPSPSV